MYVLHMDVLVSNKVLYVITDVTSYVYLDMATVFKYAINQIVIFIIKNYVFMVCVCQDFDFLYVLLAYRLKC